MSHLGELAAALADNELSHDARDRALAHVTRCEECRLEVDLQRRVRSLLANQADPQLPAGLADRLRSIAADHSPAAPRVSADRERRWPQVGAAAVVAPASRPAGTRRPRISRPASRQDGRSRGRVVRRALAGTAVAFALTAGLATAGGPTAAGPATTPPVDRFVQQHTVMTARLPFGDAGAGVVESVVLGR